jgi:hypothetical protein
MNIFLAEIARELTGFLEHCARTGLNPSDFTIVSLEPEVKVLCREKGLTDVDTLSFFNTRSHQRVLGKSDELTTLIHDNLSIDVEKDVETVFIDSFIFYSRFYINNFLWIIEVLKGIHEKYGQFNAFVYSREAKTGDGGLRTNPYMIKRDQFVASLTAKFCRQYELPVHVIEEENVPVMETETKNDRMIHHLVKSLARMVFKLKLKKFSRFNTVFTTVPSYNLDRVCSDIRAQFPGTLAVTDLQGAISSKGYFRLFVKELLKLVTGKAIDRGLTSVPVRLFNMGGDSIRAGGLVKIKDGYNTFASQYRGAFEYGGCSFWEEFNRKVEADLLDTLAGIYEAAEGQRYFLHYLKPKLVLSPVSTAESQGWARVSGSMGIPSLVVPQKTLLVPSKEFARIEERYIGRAQVTETFENAAAQSPLVTKYLEWSGYKGNTIETGNLIFARLNPQKRLEIRDAFLKEIAAPPGTQIIVWAPSMKTRRSRRFYVLESIDELTSAMEDVFDVVSRMENVHLVFRIHPGDAITKDEIYKLLPVPSNISVSDSGSFESVLAAADLLLSFSSTAVQEALINYIPILLYDKWNRYNHLDAPVVEADGPTGIAAAYYVHKKEHLAGCTRWILDQHSSKDIPVEIFNDYVFIDDRLPHFFRFVEACFNR